MPPEPPISLVADSPLVSSVTLVLNVQLQKTPYLDKTNDDTEKQWSKIYIISIGNSMICSDIWNKYHE